MAMRRSLYSLAQGLRQGSSGLAAETAFAQSAAVEAAALGSRNAATLAAVKMRIKSVQNIKKITSAMKMVAASKMKRAQVAQAAAKGLPISFMKLFGETPDLPVTKTITLSITSDKGLCGGLNTQIAKLANGCISVDAAETEKTRGVIAVGTKGAASMRSQHPDLVANLMSEYTKNPITFALASAMAEEVLKTEYDSLRVLYTSFKSAISFKPTIMTILSPETLEKSDEIAEKFDQYEIEGPDRPEFLQNYAEFQLASMLYYAMNESATSEHASRMSAMEASTKNSKELLEKLTLTFNRSRQAKITTELNEIISGALSLEDSG